ncbi:MAG: nicotinamide-nucleotide amidohydrolase family protein, partial [Bacteroidales bacterium]|nr:nicotinamide-nucleotide amidohydrolase family protein [Bacteroidales bacterium]
PWEDALPSHIRLAYLPSPGMVKLRLTGTGTDRARLSKEIEEIAERLKPYLPDGLYESEEIPLEKVIGKMLKEHHLSLAVSESCTGGFLAHLMTRYPGSSQFFKGGIVAYSNEIKEHLLHVDSKVLEVHGAVSEEVVRQMAESVRLQFHADWGIGISGIAGPDGGTTRKPVGTVWIAVSNDSETTARLFHFGTDRNRNILRAAMAAMNLLRLRLSD